VREVRQGGRRWLATTTWLAHPRWLLICRQEVGAAFRPLRNASLLGLLAFLVGAAGAIALAAVVARRQVRRIAEADREKEALTHQLLATARTAGVGELSAGLAHEINNPLAIIDTLRTWISDLAGSPSIAEADRREIIDSAQKIGDNVERCKTITHGLLKFSRRVESAPEEVNVNALLGELATVARARARVENAALELDLGPVPPVWAPPGELMQVFVNVVNNAIDAVSGRPDGQVTVRSDYAGGRVVVEVRDNGCGIPAEHLTRLFQPFFTTKPPGKGTGLGLAICHGLVEKLGGRIRVASQVGKGTAFTIVLPAIEAAEAVAERYP
jgi:two-component system NtrC family sensor kinase